MKISKNHGLMLLFAIGLVSGLLLGHFIKPGPNNKNSNDAYMSSLKEENARLAQKVEELNNKLVSYTQMRHLLGKVISIGDGSLVMEIDESQKKLFGDVPLTRTILIDPSTKIVFMQQKTPQEIQQDIDRYYETVKGSDKSDIPPPGRHKEVPITLGEIHEGDRIVVDAGKDVKTQTTVSALKISLIKIPVPTS